MFHARSYLFHKYLHENEFLRKHILTCLSGAQMGLIHEKNAKKSRDTATLKCCFLIQTILCRALPPGGHWTDLPWPGLQQSWGGHPCPGLPGCQLHCCQRYWTEWYSCTLCTYPDPIKENPDPDSKYSKKTGSVSNVPIVNIKCFYVSLFSLNKCLLNFLILGIYNEQNHVLYYFYFIF